MTIAGSIAATCSTFDLVVVSAIRSQNPFNRPPYKLAGRCNRLIARKPNSGSVRSSALRRQGANNSRRANAAKPTTWNGMPRFRPKPCSPIWHISGIGDNQVAAM